MDDYVNGFYAACRLFGGLTVVAIIVVMIIALIYEWLHQGEDTVRELLDTSPKEELSEKMEGNTTYCYPQDEGPLTKICPFCGALYPSHKVVCAEDRYILQPFHKPITEPLPEVTTAKLDTLIQDINEAEQQFEAELEKVRHELEEKAYRYGNRKRPYTFTEQEALSLYNLAYKVHKQRYEEGKAS